MPVIRAFIAVEIGPSAKQKISGLILYLKKSNADVKWVTDNQMHLTLKFLGNIDQDKNQEISGVLSAIAKNTPLFTINFSKIGGFPNLNHPRVIWLGIDKGVDSLISLSEKIETELEKLAPSPSPLPKGERVRVRGDFEKEKRKFTPHLTLGRARTSKNISELAKLINETDFQIENEIKIDKLILFQSTLTPSGAIYAPLSIHKLAEQAPYEIFNEYRII